MLARLGHIAQFAVPINEFCSFAEARTACLFGSELVATGGWGYRDFPDFSGTPSRTENLYVGGVP